MTGGRTRDVLEGVRAPTLVIDVGRATSNLDAMLGRADAWGVRFRPHFKTHQSADVAVLFRERGVSACAVSSVAMAAYFAGHGWNDITLAVPLNLRELDDLRGLLSGPLSPSAPGSRLGILVDSLDAITPLAAGELPGAAVWIKVDCGYGRAGIPWNDAVLLERLAGAVDAAGSVSLVGILTHEGRSYSAASADAVRAIHAESLERMKSARDVIAGSRSGGTAVEISVGDTPSASLAESMDGVDELRPGNFIFYDLMQLDIEACGEDGLAVAVACPVIGRYAERGEVVVYGGAAHLSAASRWGPPGSGCGSPRDASGGPPQDPAGGRTFGCLVEPAERGLGRLRLDAPIIGLSQEHAVIRMPGDLMERTAVGSILLISPVHSCLTAALHDHYVTLDGRRFGKM